MFLAFFLVVSSLLSIGFTHILVNGSWASLSLWLQQAPDAVLFSISVLALMTLLLFLITRSLRISIGLIHGLFFSVSLISWIKRNQFGWPLYPWDFLVSGETMKVLPGFIRSSPENLIYLVLAVTGWILLVRRIPKVELGIRGFSRWILLSGSVLLFALVALKNNPIHSAIFRKHFQIDLKKPNESFSTNGLLISFVLMVEEGEIFPPEQYTTKRVHTLRGQFRSLPAHKPHQKPDIIAVMSESLFDPLELDGVKWKKDPLAYTRSLVGKRPLSLAVVPTFGYRTANTEFEFLTGHSASFFAKGTIPYIGLIDGPQLSLVRSLKDSGYHSTAIHPGDPDFYNRRNVYKNFGFDQFISLEGFNQPRNYGNQVADEEILPILENSLNQQTGPSFHFVVTIQNHHPYLVNPFDLSKPMFETDGLAKDEQVVLNYYAQLLEATDRFHGKLVKLLSKRTRPTVLILFGDHLPPLLPNFGVFRNRLVHSVDPTEWTEDERLKMYQTPLVIWSNFPIANIDHSMQVSYLGMYLAKKLGLPLRPYHEFVAHLADQIPLFNSGSVRIKDKESTSEINDYQVFQYATFTHEGCDDKEISPKGPNVGDSSDDDTQL